MKPSSRAFETTLTIDAAAEIVWEALTDPRQIVQWFALNAEVSPGAGGRWMVDWDGQWPWKTEIEAWEPGRRLSLLIEPADLYDADGKAISDVTGRELVIDWYLEGKGGTNDLRLVHSGFGRDASWDDEFDGVSLGWQLELNSLKHYVEHHRGGERRIAWARAVLPMSQPAVWERLVAPEGLLSGWNVQELKPGASYERTLSTGDCLVGTVVLAIPGRAVQVTSRGFGNGLFRVSTD